MEQEEYTREEIDWSYIEFIDNQDILDMIEKVEFYFLATTKLTVLVFNFSITHAYEQLHIYVIPCGFLFVNIIYVVISIRLIHQSGRCVYICERN